MRRFVQRPNPVFFSAEGTGSPVVNVFLQACPRLPPLPRGDGATGSDGIKKVITCAGGALKARERGCLLGIDVDVGVGVGALAIHPDESKLGAVAVGPLPIVTDRPEDVLERFFRS